MIVSRTAVAAWVSLLSAELSETLKKYFIAKHPLGVSIVRPVVTLLTVLSCIPTLEAISLKTIGFRCESPFSKNSSCCATIADAIVSVVEFLCSTDLFNHLAEAIVSEIYVEELSSCFFELNSEI